MLALKSHLGIPVRWELCYLFWKYMEFGYRSSKQVCKAQDGLSCPHNQTHKQILMSCMYSN